MFGGVDKPIQQVCRQLDGPELVIPGKLLGLQISDQSYTIKIYPMVFLRILERLGEIIENRACP